MSVSALESTLKPERPWALTTLPPLPAIALRVLELVTREDADLRDVVRSIQSDPVFAVELLRAANAARFSFAEPVLSLHQAALALGLEFVKSLAVTVALRAYLNRVMKVPALRRCWRHSVACAMLSEELATAANVKREPGYTAGLLHDLGRIGLLAAYPDEYSNMLGVSAEFALDVLDCERDLFDVDHCQAGAWLAREWKLPEPIIEAIARHHQDPPEAGSTLALVSLGCRWADTLGYSVLPMHNTWTLEQIHACLPERVRERYHPDPGELRRRVSLRLESLM